MGKVIEMRPLLFHDGLDKRYQNDVADLVNILCSETIRTVKSFSETYNPKLKNVAMDESPTSISNQLKDIQKSFDKRIDDDGKKIVIRMVKDQLRASNLSVRESIQALNPDMETDKDNKALILLLLALLADNKLSSKIEVAKGQNPFKYITPSMREAIQASVIQNISYLKNVAADYITKVSGSVMRNIVKGDLTQLRKEVVSFSGQAVRRAKNIASDQVRKAYQAINLRNMESAGITKFKWVYTYRSNEPRPFHRDVLNGKIFDIGNPPIIDEKTGERGFPSQLPQCKCVMQPVISA